MGRLGEIEEFLVPIKQIEPYSSYAIDVEYLLSEVNRLRKAIEKHRQGTYGNLRDESLMVKRDAELYKVLDE